MTAPTITLRLPSVLRDVVGREELEVHGESIAEALESAFEAVPTLRRHLTVDSGELRPHVLCLHNGVNLLRDQIASVQLADGDEILIHQAISGG